MQIIFRHPKISTFTLTTKAFYNVYVQLLIAVCMLAFLSTVASINLKLNRYVPLSLSNGIETVYLIWLCFGNMYALDIVPSQNAT